MRVYMRSLSTTFLFSTEQATPTNFTVQFNTSGSSVSGASGTGDFAELQVLMSLQDLSDSANKASAQYLLDIEGGTFSILDFRSTCFRLTCRTATSQN